MSERPTGVVTFLFADIVGSTEKWASFPDLMSRMRTDLISRAQRCMSIWHGFGFKIVGDELCIAFNDPIDAVRCALAIRKETDAEHFSQVGGLKFRYGIHTGNAYEEELDYNGPTVNLVARIMSAAGADQIVATSVVNSVMATGYTGFSLRRVGFFRLKGIAAPILIFQILEDGYDESWLQAPRDPLLPRYASPFVGRKSECERLLDLLQNDAIVTIVGQGGIGKTRLAVEVLACWVEQGRGAAHFVDLLRAYDDVPAKDLLAQALGIAGRLQNINDLANVLSGPRLIVFDNCENLVGVDTLISDLTRSCTDLRVLTTSRERVVEGERVFAVSALPLDDAERLLRVLAERSAIEIEAADAEFVRAVCGLLQGSPLCIELAVPQLRTIGAVELLRDLEQNGPLEILKDGKKLIQRHKSARDMVEWSFLKLPIDSQRFFTRAAFWEAEFDHEGAAALLIELPEQIRKQRAAALLHDLVEKNLLITSKHRTDRKVFRFHPVIRDYATEKLRDSEDLNHLFHECALMLRDRAMTVASAYPSVMLPSPTYWPPSAPDAIVAALRTLAVHAATVRKLLFWLMQHDREMLVSFAGSLVCFWRADLRIDEGESLCLDLLERDPSVVSCPLCWMLLANGLPELAWKLVNMSGNVERGDLEFLRLRAAILAHLALSGPLDLSENIIWSIDDLESRLQIDAGRNVAESLVVHGARLDLAIARDVFSRRHKSQQPFNWDAYHERRKALCEDFANLRDQQEKAHALGELGLSDLVWATFCGRFSVSYGIDAPAARKHGLEVLAKIDDAYGLLNLHMLNVTIGSPETGQAIQASVDAVQQLVRDHEASDPYAIECLERLAREGGTFALPVFKKLDEVYSDAPEKRSSLALQQAAALQRASRYDEACSVLTEALQRCANDDGARTRMIISMIECATQLADRELITQWLPQLLQSADVNVETLMRLARRLHLRGLTKEAGIITDVVEHNAECGSTEDETAAANLRTYISSPPTVSGTTRVREHLVSAAYSLVPKLLGTETLFVNWLHRAVSDFEVLDYRYSRAALAAYSVEQLRAVAHFVVDAASMMRDSTSDAERHDIYEYFARNSDVLMGLWREFQQRQNAEKASRDSDVDAGP